MNLLAWYDQYARILPWRTETSPYRTWISEVMLQQTRVDSVIPYFERFVGTIPSVSALAEADENLLLKLWEGLGYYNRVKNLKKAAIEIMTRFAGSFPRTKKEWRGLPGIGPYASGAISSIAFDEKVPAVDGNVLRVLSRIEGVLTDLSKPETVSALTSLAEELLPDDRIGDHNQAMMELGALICVPNKKPDCNHCPVCPFCGAFKQNLTESIPEKAHPTLRRLEKKTVFLLKHKGGYALRQRTEKGLLSGMWEFPNTSSHLSIQEAQNWLEKSGFRVMNISPAGNSKHLFSHVEWDMIGFSAEVEMVEETSFIFVVPQRIEQTFSVPIAFRHYRNEILKTGNSK